MTLNVVLVGAESAAVQVLPGVGDQGHRVVAVLAEESTGAGLARTARALGAPLLPASRVTDPAFAVWIAEREVDLLLNVHSLSIIPGEVVAAPRIGSFNLHPGPLPAYAGLNVVTWAIARGEESHGVTLHWMDAGIDTGGIAYEARFPITPQDTGLSVFAQCVRAGVPLVLDLLAAAAGDPASIPSRPHVGERRVFRRRDVPEEGRIDWSRPARRVHDLVRASDFGPFPSPCGHPVTGSAGKELGCIGSALTGRPCAGVAPGTVGPVVDGAATVAAADEWLALRGVVVDGRRAAAPAHLREGDLLVSPSGPDPSARG
jgi:methionyl-tRNA formyltransferase